MEFIFLLLILPFVYSQNYFNHTFSDIDYIYFFGSEAASYRKYMQQGIGRMFTATNDNILTRRLRLFDELPVYNSDMYIMNYYRNKLFIPGKPWNQTVEIQFPPYTQNTNVKFLKLNLYELINKECLDAKYGDRCELPSHCVNMKKEKFQNISFCYGHTIDDDWKLINKTLPYDKPLISFVKIYPGFNIRYYFYDYLPMILPSDSFDFKNINKINITNHDLYLSVQYPDYSYLIKNLERGFYGFIPIYFNYRFVCDDKFFQHTKMLNNIYVFPSQRKHCNKVLQFNSSHHFCLDVIFDSGERCPLDTFLYAHETQQNYILNRNIPIRNKTVDIFDYIDYAIGKFFFLLDLEILMQEYFHNIKEILSNVFNFRYFIDYFIVEDRNNIDYFIKQLSNNQTHVGSQYGNWISDIFGALIKPFVQAFLEILKEFWEFLREPIQELFEVFLDIIIALLLDFEQILTKLLAALEPKLVTLIELILKLIDILLRFIVNIYVAIENKYFLSEYIIVFVIIVYYLRNTTGSLLLTIIVILIFGINRKFCSLLLTFLHKEYEIHKTNLSICYFNFTNYTKNEWFNVKELDLLIEYITLNATEIDNI